jgi:hypothetical protein
MGFGVGTGAVLGRLTFLEVPSAFSLVLKDLPPQENSFFPALRAAAKAELKFAILLSL